MRLLIVFFDILAVCLGLMMTHWMATQYGPHPQGIEAVPLANLFLPNPHMPSGIMMLGSWLAMLYLSGGYNPHRMNASARMMAATARSACGVFMVMLLLQFAVRNQTWSRFMMIAFALNSALTVGILRITFLKIQGQLPSSLTPKRLAIIGTGSRANQLANRIAEYGHQAFELVGFVAPAGGTEIFAVPSKKVLGEAIQLNEIVQEHKVETVILATSRLSRDEELVIVNRVNSMGLQLLQIPSHWGVANPRLSTSAVGDLEMVDLTALAYPTQGQTLKRTFDLALVIPASLLIGPILAVVALLIRLSDGGPALFTQQRSGQGGQAFSMYKFRSMVVNAETMRDDLQHENDAEGVLFKMRDDPRITPIGRHIRRWSLDEMPQLLNVLLGDMNLVGPRPLPMRDIDTLENDLELTYWFAQRSKVKPGITGTWQVSDRRDLKMEDMVRLDIDYIQNWSIWGDLILLARTLPAILRGRGSH